MANVAVQKKENAETAAIARRDWDPFRLMRDMLRWDPFREMAPTLELTIAGQWLQSPVDGSGVVAPAATLTLGDRLSVLATLYVPFGSPPVGGILTSEYGAAALSGLVQLRVYD